METDIQIRLRRAKEALASYQDKENQARKVLADAVASTKLAKEKYEQLFMAEERAESDRRKSQYRHDTK